MVETVENVPAENLTDPNGMPVSAIKSELNRILRSRVFVHSHRIRRFLQFVVEECLHGQQQRLKEYLIGLEVFNRVDTFDPRVDSIVRVEARRLRAKLEEYYQTEGREDEIRIELRKGSYVPLFEYRSESKGYPAGRPPLKRSLVAIGRLAPHNGESPELISELSRRLSHVLINEGYCQVVANAEPDGNGNGQPKPVSTPDYLLEGSVEQRGSDVQVLLQLLSLSHGTYLWSESGSLAEIENLARSLNRAVVTWDGQGQGSRLPRHQGHRSSFDSYVQGRYLWKRATPETIRSSASLFGKAVERDPTYGAAWAALSESLILSSVFGLLNPRDIAPQIQESAQQASELGDGLPESHVAMGAMLSIFERNWAAGEREFQKAIQLNGHDSSVHVAYGLQLACRGMLSAAMMEIERALDLDPASLTTNFVLGWLRGVGGQYDEAIAQHGLVSQLAPDFPLSYLGLGWACLGKGAFSDAVAYFTNASNLLKCRSLLSGCLGHCYARLGNRSEALRLLAQLTSQSPSQYVSPVSLAAIWTGLGDTDRALGLLEEACEAKDCASALLLLNPEFETVRKHPGYPALLQKMGL